jgi:hypothetical protein
LPFAALTLFAYVPLIFRLIFSSWTCPTSRVVFGAVVLDEGARGANNIWQAIHRSGGVLVKASSTWFAFKEIKFIFVCVLRAF